MKAQNKAGSRQCLVLGAWCSVLAPSTLALTICCAVWMTLEIVGRPPAALWAFVVFCATRIAITWWYCARRGAERAC